MNWLKLKEKFPLSYDEIRAFAEESETTDGHAILHRFLQDKGYKVFYSVIGPLRAYESTHRATGD